MPKVPPTPPAIPKPMPADDKPGRPGGSRDRRTAGHTLSLQMPVGDRPGKPSAPPGTPPDVPKPKPVPPDTRMPPGDRPDPHPPMMPPGDRPGMPPDAGGGNRRRTSPVHRAPM